MTRLSDLTQKIKDLPEIDKKRDQLKIVKDVRQQARTVLEGLTRAKRQAPYIEGLTRRHGLVKGVAEVATLLRTEAEKLACLTSRTEFGKETAITAALEALKRPLPRITKMLSEAWSSYHNRVAAFQELATIAIKLELKNAKSLRQAIDGYALAASKPPETSDDVETIKAATQQIETSVTSSGLSEKVRNLLVSAARQEGDPKLLLEEEVKTFLDQHPSLWKQLKVKLG